VSMKFRPDFAVQFESCPDYRPGWKFLGFTGSCVHSATCAEAAECTSLMSQVVVSKRKCYGHREIVVRIPPKERVHG
jgi:hypothetical protein